MNEILIVDDDQIARKFLRRMLHIQGYTCAEVEHGEAAIEHLRYHQPRLIITANQLPVMSGLQLLETVSEILNAHSIPVILLAKKHEASVVEQSKQFGVKTVMSKPLNYQELRRTVTSVLSGETIRERVMEM